KISDWTHVNTLQLLPANQWYKRGDERFKPGNLLIQPRNWWTFIIIDRESGKAVWEYHGHYRGGISGGHDAHMIPEGLPGAGNILVFDNGTETHKGESIILEINPHTNEIVWKYEDGTHFFSKTRGAVQRLPNGNTFISEDLRGRCFEVTKEGKIVWEYISPVEINRARRYPLEYCPVCAKT
ncbi:MAG: thioredoxin, partial [Candidatus Dadabacteria bacterium]